MLPIRATQPQQLVIDLTDEDPSPTASSSAAVTSQVRNELTAEYVHSKQWHSTVRDLPELRNHLLLKLVKTILPEFNPANALDQRVQRVTNYLRYIEKEIFTLATSRVHYCALVAEKMSAIKQELEEKKQTRLRYQNNNTSPTSEVSAAESHLMVSEKSIDFFLNWNNYFYLLKKGHIVISPVTILKNWHWTFSPNRRHQLILKFVASVFKAADLPTTNQDHARKIAAYAASIEVKVYQSTESPADYYRTVVEVFIKTALSKVVERRLMRLEVSA